MLINYLSDILPVRRKLAAPVCLNCGHPQQLKNYLFWPRKCPNCGERRSNRTYIVEIASVLALLVLWYFPEPQSMMTNFWVGAALLFFFGVVVVIDIEWRLILHPVSIFGALLGLAVGVWLHGWQNTLIGGLMGYTVMFTLYFLGGLFTKLLGRMRGQEIDEVALGFGDVNLTGVLGLMLGIQNILIALILSILMGAVVSVVIIFWNLVRSKYRVGLAIPYGPFLVLGAVLVLFAPSTAQKLLVLFFPLFAVGK